MNVTWPSPSIRLNDIRGGGLFWHSWISSFIPGSVRSLDLGLSYLRTIHHFRKSLFSPLLPLLFSLLGSMIELLTRWYIVPLGIFPGNTLNQLVKWFLLMRIRKIYCFCLLAALLNYKSSFLLLFVYRLRQVSLNFEVIFNSMKSQI